MKFVSVSVILFSTVVLVKGDPIDALIKAHQENDNSVSGGPGPRNLENILSSGSFENLKHYGCWCNLEDPSAQGKGAPVDAMDALCKQLNAGYRCAVMDMVDVHNDTDVCEPWTISYVGGGNNLNSLVAGCEINNSDQCSTYACIVESAFAASALNVLLSEFGALNPDFNHAKGFDYEKQCSTGPGQHHDPEEKCCGELPFRFPYRSAERECCGIKTHDPNFTSCCNGDTVKLTC